MAKCEICAQSPCRCSESCPRYCGAESPCRAGWCGERAAKETKATGKRATK